MPRDVVPPHLPTTAEEFVAAPLEHRLLALARELRFPTVEHIWDFRYIDNRNHPCGSAGCAVGVCRARFGVLASSYLVRDIETYDIGGYRPLRPIFGFGDSAGYPTRYYGKQMVMVQREDVAAALESFVRAQFGAEFRWG